jgi:hypothetical protein
VSVSGTLIANAGYNGVADKNLLNAGASTLAAGASATITVAVDVKIATASKFENSATTTALDPAGTPVSDVSQNGADPDPDRDGDPSNNGDPTPVVVQPGLLTAPMLDLRMIVLLALMLLAIGLVQRHRARG